MDVVIDNKNMLEMLKVLFKNSDRQVVKELKKYVKKQRNPFKDHYQEFITDKDTYLFLSDLLINYLSMPKNVRPGMAIKEIKDEKSK